MIQRGAKGTDEEFGEVVDYLVAHFPKGAPVPKVNVNKADAEDIVAGLGVSDAARHGHRQVSREEGAPSNHRRTAESSRESMRRQSKRKRTSWNSEVPPCRFFSDIQSDVAA